MTTPPNRTYTQVGENGYASVTELYVTGDQRGPGVAALFVEGDPNGAVSGEMGQLAVDRQTGLVYQNTDGAFAWVLFAPGGGSAVMQSFRISPMAPDPFGPGVNMPTGIIDNYADPSLPSYSLLWFKGADNEATRLSGIDATGLVDGDVRLFINIPQLGLGSRDACQVILLDRSNPDAAGSAAGNQFSCPGATNYTVPFWGHVWLIRGPSDDVGGPSVWHVLGQNAWAQKAVIQSLNFYPNLQVGNPGVPLTGHLNDWNPTGESPYGVGPGAGIAGSDLRFNDHTVIRMFCGAVPEEDVRLTGMLVEPITDGPVAYGPVKILVNEGPGSLTVEHLSASSAVGNRIYCPYSRNLTVPVNGAVMLMHMYPNLPDAPIQWRVLGLSNEQFPSVNTAKTTTTKGFALSPHVTAFGGALPAVPTVTSDLAVGIDAGSVDVITDANGSIIDGMEPDGLAVGAPEGTVVVLRNAGGGPLIILDEATSASAAGNRFVLPNQSPVVVPSLGLATFKYATPSGRWNLVALGGGETMCIARSPLSITPAVLAAANVNNYSPTDAVTLLAGRYAYWWRIQGSVGTVLTGIDAAPAGIAPFRHGDRILLTNYASGMMVNHADAASAANNRIFCPGGANIVLPNLGSIELIRDEPNAKWFVIGKSL